MKKYSLLYSLFLLTCFGCFKKEHNKETTIVFGTSGEYPPFEFYEQGELVGFDIDLGNMIAAKLGKEAVFEDIPFETILGSLTNQTIDAGLSMFTITPERQAVYDCSIPYYAATLSVVYSKEKKYLFLDQLQGKKMGAQLGSAQELWLGKNRPDIDVATMSNNNQLIEALKSGHLEMVMLDEAQAKAFCLKNEGLAYFNIQDSSEPNGVLLLKNSALTSLINKAIKELLDEGKIDELIKKWIIKN